jgi:hypothetical protein
MGGSQAAAGRSQGRGLEVNNNSRCVCKGLQQAHRAVFCRRRMERMSSCVSTSWLGRKCGACGQQGARKSGVLPVWVMQLGEVGLLVGLW